MQGRESTKKLLEELKTTECQDKKGRNKELKMQLKEAYNEEELFWSQKSRVQWLKEGDRNTHVFHSSVKGKRKRSKLQNIQKKDRSWTRTEEGVDQADLILEGISQTIIHQMNIGLIEPVEEKEIKEVLFSMNPNKSPGLDGMTPIFFWKFWPILKADIIQAINSFFQFGHMLLVVEHTIISLIPKVETPLRLSNSGL